jgi:hypothetical protein
MRELHAQGMGIKANAADPVTMEDEVQLLQSGVFNVDTAVRLKQCSFQLQWKKIFGGFQDHEYRSSR